MSTVFTVKCKTEKCSTWLTLEHIDNDTDRSIIRPLKIRDWEQYITCPDCNKEHLYTQHDLEKRVTSID